MDRICNWHPIIIFNTIIDFIYLKSSVCYNLNMKIRIYYLNCLEQKLVGYQKLFKTIANKIFEEYYHDGAYEISVTITNDEEIHKYNLAYRNIDRPTDVLSFAFEESDSLSHLTGVPVQLGDIIISYPTAKRQATEYGHKIKREMAFLFTHGLLHLIGYDHMTKDDEKEMFDIQKKVLSELNINR